MNKANTSLMAKQETRFSKNADSTNKNNMKPVASIDSLDNTLMNDVSKTCILKSEKLEYCIITKIIFRLHNINTQKILNIDPRNERHREEREQAY